ncbi:hypothetical protein BDR03DRAFT_1017589 [Suillus americanus]|nr:hypothetical protein BDR03DRAFT_1017589 [Suillus americanus]
MSPPESALPPLIDLSMETLAPTTPTPTFPDASAIEITSFKFRLVNHESQVSRLESPRTDYQVLTPNTRDLALGTQDKTSNSKVPTTDYRLPTTESQMSDVECRHSALNTRSLKLQIGKPLNFESPTPDTRDFALGTQDKHQNLTLESTDYR